MRITTISIAAGAFAVGVAPAVAWATPQPLPFTYVYETLPEGDMEVEQYVDLTPVKVLASTGTPQYLLASQFQTEFEYGISDRLELGLYATFQPTFGSQYVQTPTLTEGTGVKERLRLRLAEAGQWPVDVGLYGEVVENEREIELEAKIILERRIDDLRIIANLWGEREYYYVNQADWVINPTLGMTYQVAPWFHPGVESWLRAEYPSPAPATRTFNLGPQVYVGPTAMLNLGKLWWSTGVYIRATDTAHSLQPGVDAFGSVWVRTIIGLSL
jgi:hypothetical protein